jgi:predicted dehydrogenase
MVGELVRYKRPDLAVEAFNRMKAKLVVIGRGEMLAELKKMLAAVRKAGIVHMLCHNYRRAPAVMLARELVASGKLGRIHHYRGTYLQDWPVDPDVPLIRRFDRKIAGSGALGDILSHSLDLGRFVLGSEVVEVAGAMDTFVKQRPRLDNPRKKGRVTVDDASLALARFANGALASIEGTRFAPGRKNYLRFEVNGSRGSIVFNFERMNELEYYSLDDDPKFQGFRQILATDPSHAYFDRWWPGGHLIGYEHTFIHTLYDFLNAVAAGKQVRPNFEDGVRNQMVLDAIEKAAQTKRWVTVKPL